MSDELQERLEFAHALARQAGAGILARLGDGGRVDDKLGQPVTEADREANELIVNALARRFPQDAILAEETPVTSNEWSTRERCWVVDPLDGTSDFVKGREGFAVMIGLLERGRPTLGVVFVPKVARCFLGIVGRGAREERGGTSRPLAVSRRAHCSELRVIASISHRDARLERALTALAPAETLQVGSVGYKVGKIVADEADLYVAVTASISLWDTCAPEAILHAAGGRFLDLDGRPLDYGGPHLNHRRGLLATNGAAAPEIVARLAGRFPDLD
ncbi:MAG: 3'(2'),5'-bisphosphate nucleotidase CysQ family protein [Planctomycetota bacterium]